MDRTKKLEEQVATLEEERDFYRSKLESAEKRLNKKPTGITQRLTKLHPQEGDIICISGDSIDSTDTDAVKRMLNDAGIKQCFIYTVPDDVTIQVFSSDHHDVFEALIHGPCYRGVN